MIMHTWVVYKGSADGTIRKSTATRGPLKGNEVLILIEAAGLCGYDRLFQTSTMALGHEGAGVVEAIGPGVCSLLPGDRVGWGYQHGCCHSCQYCLSGRETYCPSRSMYGESNLDQGAFATHAIWNEPFLFKLPETMSSIDAAPLLCAGAAVFSALKTDHLCRGRVGIFGMGGLGHLAIQFAANQGRSVVVLSQSEEKRTDALNLGAEEFYAINDAAEQEESEATDLLETLLVTSAEQPGAYG